MSADPTDHRAVPSAAPSYDRDRTTERHAPLGLYARKIAHDLNNFATVIRTYSELLLSETPADSTTHADVAEIHRAADAMIAYVQRVARFARVGSMRVGVTNVDLAIANAVAAQGASSATVTFDTRQGTPLDAIPTDANWLGDVLRELIENARDAAPPGGAIVLTRDMRTLTAPAHFDASTVPAGRWAVISVSDHGAGFADEVRANAEDPFVTTKDGVRAAGFGLTLALFFAHAQGGQLTRERVDECTVVSLWLPAPQ